MQIGQEINVNDIPETSAFAPLPADWYQASISKVELKTATAGTSTYMNIQYAILGPSQQGRVVFGMCGVSNTDPKKEETSRYFLGQLMRACGITKLDNTDQLVGANLEIQLTIKPAVMEKIGDIETEKYPAGNNVKSYRSIAGSAMPKVSQVEEAGSGSAPPWAK